MAIIQSELPEMTAYRRNRMPGGTFFFTVNLNDRKSRLLVQHIDVLRDAVRQIRQRAPFYIDAWVVLPEHMHCRWTLADGDVDYSGRWQAIKMAFSRKVPAGDYRSANRTSKRERGIWQRRFWEHTIRNEQAYAVYMDYIHFSPVKHGHVTHVADWPYSSFHHAVALGLYPHEWAPTAPDLESTGEA